MKPPVCEICQKRLTIGSADKPTGGLVWFKDYRDLPQGMVGHPKGLGWFCEQHYQQAQLFSDHSKADAIGKIRSLL
ncbi:MAG: hypothetical protein DWP95_05000 [Proteobacteria bacterium]|nr:MAG: hypothetical protein DWP95_05000 [Pseudomonadota bacterium]